MGTFFQVCFVDNLALLLLLDLRPCNSGLQLQEAEGKFSVHKLHSLLEPFTRSN